MSTDDPPFTHGPALPPAPVIDADRDTVVSEWQRTGRMLADALEREEALRERLARVESDARLALNTIISHEHGDGSLDGESVDKARRLLVGIKHAAEAP